MNGSLDSFTMSTCCNAGRRNDRCARPLAVGWGAQFLVSARDLLFCLPWCNALNAWATRTDDLKAIIPPLCR
jgi:hypothetical protein